MTLPRVPEAVVFDMDGLLFDTETLYVEAAVTTLTELGHDASTEIILRTTGGPWTQTRQLLLEHFGPAFPADDFVTVWIRNFRVLAEARLALKPGVLELLDLLDRLGVPKAIATSSSHATVQHHLAAHNLTDRFDAIAAAGDYAAGKPAPDPFLLAAERVGVDPAYCLALEDSYNGVRSASAAGMMAVMVPDLLPPTDEIRALCTLVAGDLHEVRELILAVRERD